MQDLTIKQIFKLYKKTIREGGCVVTSSFPKVNRGFQEYYLYNATGDCINRATLVHEWLCKHIKRGSLVRDPNNTNHTYHSNAPEAIAGRKKGQLIRMLVK